MKKFSSLTLLKVATAPAVLGLALLSTAAFAQEPQSADDSDEGTAIIVTGSRIQTTSAASVAPVQVITAEAIQASGVINIQDELLKNPAFGTPSFSRTANAFNSAGPGIATVDLRNLGVDRTLVLVNGRRSVSGVPGGNAVDLNTIPTPLIERVEVLTSGSASAIYGSDAVAGVVNFILKDDFQGLEINAQSGIAETGDDFNLDTSVLVGGNFADGRGNVTLFMGYSEQGAVMKRDHYTEAGQSNIDNISDIFYGVVDGKLTTPRQPFYSGYAPQGTYFTDNYAWTYGNNGLGALRPCSSTNGGICDLSGTPLEGSALDGTQIGPDGFNRTGRRYLAVPIQRYLISANGHYDVTDHITAFFEGSFVNAHAKSQIEPFPWDTDTSGKQYANGQMPIETLYQGAIVRNPFVPDQIFNDASDTDGDGLRDIFVSKRLFDFGDRAIDSTQQTFRMVGGLRGDITDKWSFEVFGNYGQTNVNQTGTGQINVVNFRETQKIVPNGNGGFMCADPNAVADGCVPANVFGLNSFSPEALTFLEAPSNYVAVLKETQIGGNITGSLPSLWGADPLGVTVGVEYRREASSERWDALQSLGLNGSNAFPPTAGSFDVREAFGEVVVPLISKGFVHELSLRGAARFSDYSTVGNTFSWNAGGEFAPIADVRFRAMYAVTVRAPNISELFAGANQDFPSVDDPCEGVGPTGGGALGDNCRAAPGVSANIAANGTFLVSQSDRQGVTSFGGGNPNLSEEKGKTFTAGVVINPRSIDALRNLTLSVDYFSVKIEDAIVDTPLQFILDQCYGQGNTSFCDFVVRRTAAQGTNTSGSLREVNNGPSNSGGIRTSGIDVTLNYIQGIHFGSNELKVGVSGSYTHLITAYTVPLPGADTDHFKGEIGSATDRFSTDLSVSNEKFKLSFSGTYIGVSYGDDQWTGAPAGTDPEFRIHPEFYLDSQLRFYATDKIEMYVGMNNILNNKPAYFGGTPDATTGQDSDTGTYDPLGRRFYAGAKLRF